jgi:SAM-dependent methyltransferase
MDLLSPYDSHLLWKVVFPTYLPASASGLKVIEIGSAPGDFLVRFAKTLGATPYGVEYTTSGAQINRETFSSNGLNPQNVIEADFISDEFLSAYQGVFDIVVSRGFIEHFENVEEVIQHHVSLIQPGGHLVILIPNLSGFYGIWTRLFNPEQIPIHNLKIMEIARFAQAFSGFPLETRLCSYFGTFSFWMCTAPHDARFLNFLVRALIAIQRPLNLVFRLVLPRHGFESRLFSPSLIFVGRKKA